MEHHTAGSVLEIYDENLRDITMNDVLAGHISMATVEAGQELLARHGLEKFLGDGKFTVEEFLVTAAEVGKAHMAKDPGKYNPNEETLQQAGALLARRGIDDPDGTLAQGLAASAEYTAHQWNGGSMAAAPAREDPRIEGSPPAISRSPPQP